MASGHVNRANRPNTWVHRPNLQREDSPCQLGAVHTWGYSGHSTHIPGGQKMKVSAKRMAVLREHVRAESEHDMEALLSGMTPDCFNDVVGVPKPFVGPE